MQSDDGGGGSTSPPSLKGSLAKSSSPQIDFSPTREPSTSEVDTPPGIPQPRQSPRKPAEDKPSTKASPQTTSRVPAKTQKQSESRKNEKKIERKSEKKKMGVVGNTQASDKSSSGEVVLVMTVEIADGMSDAIEVREGDSAATLAQQFCAKNNLPDRVVGPLTSHIEGNLSRVMQQRTSEKSTPERRRGERPSSAVSSRSKSEKQVKPKQRPKSAVPREAGGVSIHERLHNQAKEKAEKLRSIKAEDEAKRSKEQKSKRQGMSWVSQQMTLGRNTGDYQNYGERLYVEGVLNKERKLELEARHKKEEEKKMKKLLRSRPEISTVPPSMDFHRQDNRKAIWSRLYEPNFQHRNTKVELMRREKEMQEMEECTFKPKISHRSKQIVGQRTRALNQHGIPLHEQLYQEAEQRQRRFERYACWFPDHVTFQPQVSTEKIDDSDYKDVIDRLYARKDQANRRLYYLKEELERPVDNETGQEFFKPKIGRKPHFQRNIAKLPIGNYLYGMRYEFDDKKEFLHTMDEQIRDELVNQVFTTDRSEKLTTRMKGRRFREIFSLLDANGDGVIDLDEMKKLPAYERFSDEIKTDLLFARESTGEFKDDIDLETFTYLMEHAVEMNVFYRHYLQPDIRIVEPHPDETYHPKINSYSQKLAKKRRERDGYPVFESLFRDQVINKEHLELLRKELDQERMRECTFQPRLNFSASSTPVKGGVYGGIETGDTFHLSRLDFEEEDLGGEEESEVSLST